MLFLCSEIIYLRNSNVILNSLFYSLAFPSCLEFCISIVGDKLFLKCPSIFTYICLLVRTLWSSKKKQKKNCPLFHSPFTFKDIDTLSFSIRIQGHRRSFIIHSQPRTSTFFLHPFAFKDIEALLSPTRIRGHRRSFILHSHSRTSTLFHPPFAFKDFDA